MYVQLLYQVLILMKQDSSHKKHSEKLVKLKQNSDNYFLDSNENCSSDDDNLFNAKKSNPETKDHLKYQVYHLLYDVIKKREEAIN